MIRALTDGAQELGGKPRASGDDPSLGEIILTGDT